MNDSELMSRVHKAFDDIEVPPEVKESTLDVLKKACEESSSREEAVESRQAAKPRFKVRRFVRRSLAAAACAAALILGVGGYSAFAQPTAYVDIDVNPSIELRLNRFDMVVEVQALNEDGEAVLANVALEGKGYDEAMRILYASPDFSTYLTPDSYLQISVTSSDPSQALKLEEQSASHLNELPCKGSCMAVDQETREAAQSAGVGGGKYLAISMLLEIDPSLTMDECVPMSMKELRDRIDAAGGNWDETASASSGLREGSLSQQRKMMKGKDV